MNNGQVNEQNYAMHWLVLYPESGLAVNMSINTIVDSFSDFAAFEKRFSELFIKGV